MASTFKRSGLHRLECPECPCYGYFTVAMLETAGDLPHCFARGCGATMRPERLELALLLQVDHAGLEEHARLTVNKTYSQDRSLAGHHGRSKVAMMRSAGEVNDMGAAAASELEQARASRARERRMAGLGLREVWSKPERGSKSERRVFKIANDAIPFLEPDLRLLGYIGLCPRRGGGHATRHDLGKSWGKCPDHGNYRLSPLYGEHSAARPCDARCMGARGPSCSCSCGGVNHGGGFADGAYAVARVESLSLF